MKRKAIDEYASSGKNDKFGMMYVSMLNRRDTKTLALGQSSYIYAAGQRQIQTKANAACICTDKKQGQCTRKEEILFSLHPT